MPQSLKARLILASVLWTGGLLLLMHIGSVVFMHTLPRLRASEAPMPVLIGSLLMAAGFWTARASIRPLLHLPDQVTAIRRGSTQRMDGAFPAEVRPLIDSLNALLADRERSIARADAAAGDLAHALKTPLALLAREAEAAAASGNLDLSIAIQQQVRRMASQVDYHLTRARVAAQSPTVATRCAVAPCAAALLRTVRKLYAERELEFTASVPDGLTVRVRSEDLEEMLGNLLDNACKWARCRVLLRAEPHATGILFQIEDDGPGLPEAFRVAVLRRGVRADQAAPGSGLGLSIVRDLAEHYGGAVHLDQSALGGLCVRLSLPSAG